MYGTKISFRRLEIQFRSKEKGVEIIERTKMTKLSFHTGFECRA